MKSKGKRLGKLLSSLSKVHIKFKKRGIPLILHPPASPILLLPTQLSFWLQSGLNWRHYPLVYYRNKKDNVRKTVRRGRKHDKNTE